ncbi:MAG: hypothetical protein J2P45_27095 [Candidatus Dormibacteraeota bacterium]|nr:hypothetical protein [Candidatus Dormibacteraeota bacterium]
MAEGMDRSPAEEYLFWRDEILQVMYWMLGEGLAAEAGAAHIQVFLGGDEPQLAQIMEQVAAEGFLEPRAQDRYALTELGKDAGRRSFALEFEGLLGQAHGECGPDCWCHRSAARAAQCATERLAKLYGT